MGPGGMAEERHRHPHVFIHPLVDEDSYTAAPAELANHLARDAPLAEDAIAVTAAQAVKLRLEQGVVEGPIDHRQTALHAQTGDQRRDLP